MSDRFTSRPRPPRASEAAKLARLVAALDSIGEVAPSYKLTRVIRAQAEPSK